MSTSIVVLQALDCDRSAPASYHWFQSSSGQSSDCAVVTTAPHNTFSRIPVILHSGKRALARHRIRLCTVGLQALDCDRSASASCHCASCLLRVVRSVLDGVPGLFSPIQRLRRGDDGSTRHLSPNSGHPAFGQARACTAPHPTVHCGFLVERGDIGHVG